MATFGDRLRDALERRRMDQPELADLMGVSVRAVNDWVNDRTSPRNRMGALKAWAPELGDEPDGLLLPRDAFEREVLERKDEMRPGAAEALIMKYREELARRAKAERTG